MADEWLRQVVLCFRVSRGNFVPSLEVGNLYLLHGLGQVMSLLRARVPSLVNSRYEDSVEE